MKLHCLGTAGYHPSNTRQTSCYFVPAAGLVLDAGTGFFRLPPLIETPWLDILLSHAHLDHIVGLTFLLDVLHQRPVPTVRVWGEAEKLEAIREHIFCEHIFPVKLKVQWCDVVPGVPFNLESGVTVQSWRLDHPGGSLAYKVDWPNGSNLAYVTDTTATLDAAYVQAISRVKLLLHESNFRDGAEEWAEKTGHSCTTRAAEVARHAAVEKLLLVHINPIEPDDDPVGIDAARVIFANTEIAYDGLVLDF